MGTAGVQTIRFGIVVILARLLGPADYGAAAIAVALASFAPTLGDMGISSALVQRNRATRLVRSTAFWGSFGFGLALAALFVVAAGPVGRFLDDPRIGTMVAVGALTFAIYSLGTTSQAMFMRAMNFRALELRSMVALLVAGALSIVAAASGLGAWALVLQQVALATTLVAALWWRAGWRPSLEFSVPIFRELTVFALRIAGGRWARLAEIVVLSLLIGKLLGVASLGAWTFAWSAVILPLVVIAIPIGEVLFSAFSRMQGDHERIAIVWLESIGLLAAVLFPLLAGLIVVAPDLIPLAFGQQWSVAVPVLQILSIYVIIRSLQAWNSVVLDAAGKPQITMWTQAAALCLTPVAVVVGSHWGLEAVAAAFVLGQLIAVEIPSLVFVLLELRIRLRTVVARLWGVATAALLMAMACLGARLGLSALGLDMASRVVLTIALGLLVYPAALWLLAPEIHRRGVTLVKPIVDRLLASAPLGRRA
jgi:O-antigen/teichoic acid export membrane protein